VSERDSKRTARHGAGVVGTVKCDLPILERLQSGQEPIEIGDVPKTRFIELRPLMNVASDTQELP
jgi:hypothetical protein